MQLIPIFNEIIELMLREIIMNAKRTQQRTLPVLPLRDVVVFPYMVMPLFVGRAKSISALDEAMNEGKQLLLVSQKQADLEEPTVDDVFDVGTIANIIQLLKLPDGTVKVLVEGQQRAKINQLNDGEDHFSAEVTPIETTFGDEKELDVVKAAVLNEFESYLQLNKKIPASKSLYGVSQSDVTPFCKNKNSAKAPFIPHSVAPIVV